MKINKRWQEMDVKYQEQVYKVHRDANGELKCDWHEVVDYGPYGQGFGLKLIRGHHVVADWYYCWRDLGGVVNIMGKEYWLNAEWNAKGSDVYRIESYPFSSSGQVLMSALVSRDQFVLQENKFNPQDSLLLVLLLGLIKIRDERNRQ